MNQCRRSNGRCNDICGRRRQSHSENDACDHSHKQHKKKMSVRNIEHYLRKTYAESRHTHNADNDTGTGTRGRHGNTRTRGTDTHIFKLFKRKRMFENHAFNNSDNRHGKNRKDCAVICGKLTYQQAN